MGRYTLVIEDREKHIYHNLALNDVVEDKIVTKEKVSLTAIDKYTLNNKDKFNSKEEFLGYISPKMNITGYNLDVYISYISNGSKKKLKPLFGDNPLLQNLSKKHVGSSYVDTKSADFVKFFDEFLMEITTGRFLRALQNSTYVNKHLYDTINEYAHKRLKGDNDSIADCRELIYSLEKQLSKYKDLRGMVLLVNNFNKENNERLVPTAIIRKPLKMATRDSVIEEERRMNQNGEIDESLIPDLDDVNKYLKAMETVAIDPIDEKGFKK